MKISNWTKLVTILTVAGGTIYLGTVGVLDAQAVTALLGAAMGYVFGNGHGIMEANKAGGGR